MRKTIILFSILTVLIFSNSAFALLENNGDGTITQTRNDGSMLMWLEDANTALTSGYCSTPGNCFDPTYGVMRWNQAQTWIGYLNSSNYLGYNDWRLPVTLPVNGSFYNYNWSFNGSTDWAYNIISPNSEMAYMYYVELGNKGYYNTSGSGPQPEWGLNNKGPFTNIQGDFYWSGTEYAPDTNRAWYFHTGMGLQENYIKADINSAWAVRSAGVVPEPISSILFITGGAVLVGRRYIKRRRT